MYATSDVKWGTPTIGEESGVITWSADVVDGLNYNTALYDDQDFEDSLQAAFDAWESVASVDFEQATGSDVDITLGTDAFAGSTVGYAQIRFLVLDGTDRIIEGNVDFDSTETWSPYGETDLSFYAVALHEIGHVLGLEHVDDTSEIMNPFVSTDNLGDGDIDGIQFLYGTDPEDVSTPPDIPEGSSPPNTPVAGAGPAFTPISANPSESEGSSSDDGGGIFDTLFGWIFDLFASIFGGGSEEGESTAALVLPEDLDHEDDDHDLPIIEIHEHDHDDDDDLEVGDIGVHGDFFYLF